MGSRFRKQEAIRLELDGGDWLLVRKHLTAGEEREAHARLLVGGSFTPGEQPKMDPRQLGIAQAISYLIDWNITDVDDKPISIRDKPYAFLFATLENMTTESLREIIDAIQAHEAAMIAEREHQKKTDGSSAPDPISTSAG